jgi:hypothetical protein
MATKWGFEKVGLHVFLVISCWTKSIFRAHIFWSVTLWPTCIAVINDSTMVVPLEGNVKMKVSMTLALYYYSSATV